jgi:hypothetical protein
MMAFSGGHTTTGVAITEKLRPRLAASSLQRNRLEPYRRRPTGSSAHKSQQLPARTLAIQSCLPLDLMLVAQVVKPVPNVVKHVGLGDGDLECTDLS